MADAKKWQVPHYKRHVSDMVARLSTGKLLLPMNAKREAGSPSFSFARLPVGENLACGLQR